MMQTIFFTILMAFFQNAASANSSLPMELVKAESTFTVQQDISGGTELFFQDGQTYSKAGDIVYDKAFCTFKLLAEPSFVLRAGQSFEVNVNGKYSSDIGDEPFIKPSSRGSTGLGRYVASDGRYLILDCLSDKGKLETPSDQFIRELKSYFKFNFVFENTAPTIQPVSKTLALSNRIIFKKDVVIKWKETFFQAGHIVASPDTSKPFCGFIRNENPTPDILIPAGYGPKLQSISGEFFHYYTFFSFINFDWHDHIEGTNIFCQSPDRFHEVGFNDFLGAFGDYIDIK